MTNLAELLPHRPPLLWIEGLLECTATAAVATAFFGVDHFAVVNGRVAEAALVECVAQTAAAAAGERARAQSQQPPPGPTGGASGGMLVAVTDFQIRSCPVAGSRLRIEVEERRRFGPMVQVFGKICCGTEATPVAEGVLTLYA